MARNTRNRLIEIAGDLFYRQGFQAVGLDQILSAVGITKTAFYKYFECKDDLILAVIETRDRRDISAALAYMRQHGGSDPRAQVLALFDLLAEWFREPDFRGCLFMNAATEFASPNDPIHRAATQYAEHIAAEILLRVQAAGARSPELLTKQLMLLVSGAISTRHATGAADAAATARAAADALLAKSVTASAAAVKQARSAQRNPRPLRVVGRRARRA
ncbi:MAG: TetR/AcrR family transcriptional regulator [Phycisphaerae bacterium]